MEIEQILEMQRNCHKWAKKIVKRAYRTYDRIWAQRIRVTPELEETGLIPAINGKMPNLLLRKQDADCPDIEETAAAYGFESGDALAHFLASYEPRGKHEWNVYFRLVKKASANLPPEEREVACQVNTSTLSRIVSEGKRLAKECTQEAYKKYDEVWYGKMYIDAQLMRHGKDTVSEINAKLPNFLVHDPSKDTVDALADMYGFESENDFIDWLLAYEPRGSYQSALAEKFMREALHMNDVKEDFYEANFDDLDVDTVPF